MQETIDLIEHSAVRELRSYTRRTGQPTTLERMDLVPLEAFQKIEIDEEHITIEYNQTIVRNYNTNEITHREWSYKYNDDPDFVAALARVIELARLHLREMPNNIACPPGCAQCCSGYEPFVNKADVQRIADHLSLSYEEVMRDYVNPRASADGHDIGWLRKLGDDVSDRCVFLKGTRSGRHYCGIYEGRPDDCREFTPIGCEDVDDSLPRKGSYIVGEPFRPRHRKS